MKQRFHVGDIVMYEAVKGSPFFGIVIVANSDDKHFWARYWYPAKRVWEPAVDFTHDNDWTFRIGRLPDWAETDEYFGSQLPPMS